MDRIVLAYSGDFRTSVAIPWLRDTYRADIIAVTVDLGQGYDLEVVRDGALVAGAVRAHVLDAREEFACDFGLRALKAGALYDDRYPMTASLGWPLIARKLVEIAGIEQASVIADGTREGAVDASARALNPAIRVIGPAREWRMTRPKAMEYARDRGIPVPATLESSCRADANLWGRSIDCGALEDPWTEAPEDVYTLTRSPAECPDQPASVEIAFERGVPTAINGVDMPMLDLIASLATIAGAHGVGRVDLVEHRLTGIKSRQVYEAPAAAVLHDAHKALQTLVTTREADRFSRLVGLQYTHVVSDGMWFTLLREALDAYVERVQERVTGVVRMKLFKGDSRIVGRRSPFWPHDQGPSLNEAEAEAESVVPR